MSALENIQQLALRGSYLPMPEERKRIRESTGATQEELAGVLGVHPVTISKWERGIENPTGKRLESYRLFLALAASNERRNVMEEVRRLLGWPVGYGFFGADPQYNETFVGTDGQPRQAVSPLAAVRLIERGTISLVMAQEGHQVMGGSQEYERAVLTEALIPRGLYTVRDERETAPADTVPTGIGVHPAPRPARDVKLTEVYELTPRGEEIRAAIGAALQS